MKKDMETQTIDPNRIPVRDYLLLALINGATKATIHRDKRREASKKACRRKIRRNNEE
jgi:hypothetical protein